MLDELKTCTNCGELKARDEFYKDHAIYRRSACIECLKELRKDEYQKSKSRIFARGKSAARKRIAKAAETRRAIETHQEKLKSKNNDWFGELAGA